MAGNEGNLLIEEFIQENSYNVNSTRISGSYDQTAAMITQVWLLEQYFLFFIFLTFIFIISSIREW